MTKIESIRFCMSNKNYPELHEIFKLVLTKKNDFYLTKKNGEIKISFHKLGVKYLRVDNYKHILYKDLDYSAINLNPVLVYIPKALKDYGILKSENRNSAVIGIENLSSNLDVGIKVYRVNYKDNGVFIKNHDMNTTSIKAEGYDLKDKLVQEDNKICMFDFGEQIFYFDVFKLNRNNFDNTQEHILLFKPGKEIDINNFLSTVKLPISKGQDCKISYNKKHEAYLISF